VNQLFDSKFKKISQSLEFETWEAVAIPEKIKNMIKFITHADFCHLKKKNISSLIEKFDKLEDFEDFSTSGSERSSISTNKDQENSINSNNNNISTTENIPRKMNSEIDLHIQTDLKKVTSLDANITEKNVNEKLQSEFLIQLDNTEYKIILTTFEIIILVLKCYKMLCLFDESLYEIILNKVHYFNILVIYCI
jgi:hypothetical protein